MNVHQRNIDSQEAYTRDLGLQLTSSIDGIKDLLMTTSDLLMPLDVEPRGGNVISIFRERDCKDFPLSLIPSIDDWLNELVEGDLIRRAVRVVPHSTLFSFLI